MFLKPSQKLKRILRVYLIYQKQEDQDVLKVFGHMYPNQSVSGSPKFTCFFKQVSFFFQGETQPFETVFIKNYYSGKSRLQTLLSKTVLWLSYLNKADSPWFLSSLVWLATLQNFRLMRRCRGLSEWRREQE